MIRDMRVIVAMMLASLVVVLSGGRASAQTAIELDKVEVDVSHYPEVALTFEVPDTLGASWDATVLEGGVARPAEVHTGDRGGTDVVLVLDTSGSMAGAPLDAAKAAATAFVRTLPPAVHVAVVGYGSSAYVVSPMTYDATLLEGAIAGLVAGGDTALYDALALAAAQFSREDVPRSVVLVSDDETDDRSATTLESVTQQLVDAKAQVFGLRLITGATNGEVLPGLAAVTHGQTADAADLDGLAGTFDAIASRALRQVRLTYPSSAHGATPVTVRLDGGGVPSTASLTVSLPEGPGATPRSNTLPLIFGAAALFAGLFALSHRAIARPPRSLLAANRRPSGAGGLRDAKTRFGAAMERTLERRGRREALGARLENAGIALRPGEYLVMASGVAALGFFSGFTLGGVALGLMFAVGVVSVAWLVLGIRTTKRRATIDRQLPDMLQQLTSSLRAGYGIMQALDAVARELDGPMSDELRRVIHEVQLGRALTESLEAMSGRVGGQDFGWVVQAIEINHEVGGDLVEVLDAVATTIRARAHLRRQIRTLSAQGRLSARILLAMPFAMAVLISLLNPGYLRPLAEEGAGPVLLAIGGVLMVIGWLWLRRIVRLVF